MTRLAQRAAAIAPRIAAATEQLVTRGAIGAAVRIELPDADRPILAAAGLADPDSGRAMTGDELFPIASQSKLFTAMLVHQLVREGKLSFDDPVARYLPDVPAVDREATIGQFLNHTSGIGNFIHALTTLAWPWPVMSYDDLMALARMHGRQSAPGARFDYNNTDVVVLARLCETVTGQPRAALLDARVFAPLGMADTMVGLGDTARRARLAKGYYLPPAAPDGRRVDVTTVPDLSLAGAAGDITSSLADMTRLATALRDATAPAGLSLADLAAAPVDVGAEESPWFMPRTYGRGAEAWRWGGRLAWGHRGSFFGYHSGTFVEPVSGAVVAMVLTMCTSGGFMRFIDVQAHGYMSFMAECMTMAIDAAELP
jgi:D-alanyl-D-alanine carboxypeptidase